MRHVGSMEGRQASPLVRLVERHAGVRLVGSVYLGLAVAVDQRREVASTIVASFGQSRTRRALSRRFESTVVLRRWSSHATNVAYERG